MNQIPEYEKEIKRLREIIGCQTHDINRYVTIAYNAITFGQLDERYEKEHLMNELGMSESEWNIIMED